MKQFLIICSILLSSTVFGQEELRYENRQFYQGEKEITYNEFYEIIKSPNEFYSSRFQDILFLSQSSQEPKAVQKPWICQIGLVIPP